MRVHRTSLSIAVLTATSLLVAACDQGGGDPADQPAVAGTEVEVVDDDFEPAHLEVDAGDTVTWVWEGSSTHDVVGDAFASEAQREGTFTHTFEAPGSYEYECTLHGGMTGIVAVVDA